MDKIWYRKIRMTTQNRQTSNAKKTLKNLYMTNINSTNYWTRQL